MRFFHFIQSPTYSKLLDGFDEQDLQKAIEDEILNNPAVGAPLKGGIHKVRVKSTERRDGKQGGYRIWFFLNEPDDIHLFYILDKHDAENLTHEQEEFLMKMLADAKAGIKKGRKKYGR